MNGSEKIFTDYIDEKGVKRRAEVLPPEVL